MFVAVAVTALAVVLATRGTSPAPKGDNASDHQRVVVYRSESCSCCREYEAYLRDAGFAVRTALVDDPATVKARLGVPGDARSCQTALVGGYVVEGHVPVVAIGSLLRERTTIDGLALPGMPPGSPGMGDDREGPLEILSFEDGMTAPYMTL